MAHEHGVNDPLARDLLRKANDQIVAADARTRDIEERYDALQHRVVKLVAAVEAAEARAKAAEERLLVTMKVLGPSLVSTLRRSA
jgi:predicted  nucleic acid-binding Zn-ribbon protein